MATLSIGRDRRPFGHIENGFDGIRRPLQNNGGNTVTLTGDNTYTGAHDDRGRNIAARQWRNERGIPG